MVEMIGAKLPKLRRPSVQLHLQLWDNTTTSISHPQISHSHKKECANASNQPQMDARQSQTRSLPIHGHLRPPPHNQPRSSATSSASTPSHSPSPTPRAPVTSHPTCTISESVILQGTHPISIGAGTIIHPRARVYSYDGPVIIGDGCIISEKSVIGVAPSTPLATLQASRSTGSAQDGLPIRLSSDVVVGPLATILPGAHIHSAVVIEALAVINRRVSVGAHSKVCAKCEISANAKIGEYTVVWGSGSGLGLRRRVRTKGKVVRPNLPILNAPSTSTSGSVAGMEMPEGKIVEEARLVVLQKERRALAKFLAPSAPGRKR